MNDSLEDRVRAILAAKRTGTQSSKSVQPAASPRKSTTGRTEKPYRPQMNGTGDTSFVSHVEEVVVGEKIVNGERRPIIELIRERINLQNTGRAPSKKQVKQATSTRKIVPANRVFSRSNGCGPGDRHPVISAIRAIAATGDGPDNGTGCIVRDESKDGTEVPTKMPGYRGTSPRVQQPLRKYQKPTTTRREGNEQGGYQVVQ